MLVVSVGSFLQSLFLYLYFRGWHKSNYHWYTHGVERLDLDHNYIIWTQQRWKFRMKEKCWFFLEAVADNPSVMTYYFRDYSKVIYPDRHIFELLTREKCWSSLWTVADGHPVVGSSYWPHNISDAKSFLLIYFHWSQRLMIWYWLQTSWLFIYEDFIEFFFVIEVKDSVGGCLYALHQFPLIFHTNLIYSINI